MFAIALVYVLFSLLMVGLLSFNAEVCYVTCCWLWCVVCYLLHLLRCFDVLIVGFYCSLSFCHFTISFAIVLGLLLCVGRLAFD